VVREFGERRDSRTQIVGLDTGLVIKHATDPQAVRWLRDAAVFHAAVRHPAIAAVVETFETPDGGFGLVEHWAPGEILVDGYDPSVPDRDAPGSPFQRFLALPADEIAAVIAQLIDAHVAVAAAGFVPVDLYDGCVIYDFEQRRLSLIDLDHYRRGPYVLEVDRQIGSTSVMAPEELERGATIDERSTVFTLGRFALVYLGCARHEPPARDDFRGTQTQWAAALAATRPEPDHRLQTVAELAARWSA
jgi:serine/threonine-protein kinase